MIQDETLSEAVKFAQEHRRKKGIQIGAKVTDNLKGLVCELVAVDGDHAVVKSKGSLRRIPMSKLFDVNVVLSKAKSIKEQNTLLCLSPD